MSAKTLAQTVCEELNYPRLPLLSACNHVIHSVEQEIDETYEFRRWERLMDTWFANKILVISLTKGVF